MSRPSDPVRQAFRGRFFHCLADPGETGEPSASEIYEDGLLLTEDGRVAELGDAATLAPQIGDTPVEDFSGHLIVPGFIDCHVHFPQVDIIASYGEQLLEWLERYAYPGEMRYADRDYAALAAEFFLDELLANGTTTAAVFATVHPQSADALFAAADKRDMRLIAGKVWMDSNCPAELRDDAATALADSRALIERWHGKGRLGYAITPRFALTSSAAQLDAAGQLAKEFPDTWIHTHLAENRGEVYAVAARFPWSTSYLDVYEQFGLLRERSLFAHCLYLSADDRKRMGELGGAAAFCPTSNLFLGSGLFDLAAMTAASVRSGLASDVGGGTSLSMLRTMATAYEVLHLQGQALPAARALYLATLGAARALYLDDHIGNFERGKEADFVVLNPAATAISKRRTDLADTIPETLFAVLMLGDDRHVAASYLNGRLARQQTAPADR
ncbi:MAG TPA: guanine deaminase [Woeseiaceae bacterium]|nr:guanine deaminase [Woeseiaceae bacterium]